MKRILIFVGLKIVESIAFFLIVVCVPLGMGRGINWLLWEMGRRSSVSTKMLGVWFDGLAGIFIVLLAVGLCYALGCLVWAVIQDNWSLAGKLSGEEK